MNQTISDDAILIMLKSREHCLAMADMAANLVDSDDAIRLVASAERLTAVLSRVDPQRLARLVPVARAELGLTKPVRPQARPI